MKQSLLFIALLFIACEPAPEGDAAAASAAEETVKAIDVRVMKLKKSDIQDYTTLTTQLKAKREINITARVSGQVRSYAENGARLSKGATVFDIDGSLFYSMYKSADAQATFAAKNAEKLVADFKKYQSLYENKDISQDELMRHEVAMLQAMQASEAATAQKRQALLNYQNASYKAPFSGVVGQMNLTVGQHVNAGEPIGKFADNSAFRAVFSLSLDEARRFANGNRAVFNAEGIALEGRILSISPLADTQTGSYLTKVEFSRAKSPVLSGQFGTVTLYGQTQKNAFVVHQDNVVLNNGEHVVYLYENGKTKRTVVQKVQDIGENVVISGSINEGDKIVITAVGRLADNIPVSILEGEK